ncbi:MAG: hypothetical protein JWQ57_5077, partial [Mucilaginibacter sp.]|nr:hypothetical protein [Mucilaginibacter sp.]
IGKHIEYLVFKLVGDSDAIILN